MGKGGCTQNLEKTKIHQKKGILKTAKIKSGSY